jgi:hypothetical protein
MQVKFTLVVSLLMMKQPCFSVNARKSETCDAVKPKKSKCVSSLLLRNDYFCSKLDLMYDWSFFSIGIICSKNSSSPTLEDSPNLSKVS